MDAVTLGQASIVQRADSLLSIFQGALSARNQAGWSRWLQGEVQMFLPHEALIAAWGDFKSPLLAYEVITRSPSLSADHLPRREIELLMVALREKWIAAGREPLQVAREELRKGPHAVAFAACALVHGVQDHRSHYDCMYLFLGPEELASAFSRKLCGIALPFIDTGFRQLADSAPAVGGTHPADVHGDPVWGEGAGGERGSALSARELEIMDWVRMGKTNSEIAMILNLSTFTVKNHMRRIYKKLDVLNRAQAVGSLDRMQGITPSGGR